MCSSHGGTGARTLAASVLGTTQARQGLNDILRLIQ